MKRTRRIQFALLTLICFALVGTLPALADVTINLTGALEPATIEITMDKADLVLDMGAGQTTASDTVNISSKSLIPVKVSLISLSHKTDSWKPSLITDDVTTLGLADAQTKARLSLVISGDLSRTVGFSKFAPTGNGSTLSTLTGTTWSASAYPLDLGAMTESPDGIAAKNAAINTTLESSKKRILSKAFGADMVLNFAADV